MSAPVLPLPHNWVARVDRTRAWPTAVLASRNGSEQTVAQTLAPRESVRYEIIAPTPELLHSVLAPILTAVTAATPEARAQVRVPRWEDSMTLATPASVSDTVLTLEVPTGEDAGYRSWTNSGEVALFIPGYRAVQILLLNISGAVGVNTLTLATGLASAWPAGTRVAPVSVMRLGAAVEFARFTGTIATAVLSLEVDTPMAGTVVITSGAPGRKQVSVVAAVELYGTGSILYYGYQIQLRAICRDASGAEVPPPGAIVWTSSAPSRLPVRVVNAESGIAFVESIGVSDGSPITITATEPVSAASANWSIITGSGS